MSSQVSENYMYLSIIFGLGFLTILVAYCTESKTVSCGEYLLDFIRENNLSTSTIETNEQGFWVIMSRNEISTSCLENGGRVSFQIWGRG